jgi:hypothetical protein
MSGLPTSAFRASNNYRTGSNVYTDFNQGGGSKKAGFPYQVGRISATSVVLNATSPSNGKCCKLTNLRQLSFTSSISRPIGRNNNVAYWHIPGTR